MAQWQDQGIVLGLRPFGEGKGVLHLFTQDHGHAVGAVRSIKSKSMRLATAPGSQVQATWRARLDEHLGSFTIDLIHSTLGTIIESQPKMLALSTLTTFIIKVFPERHPYKSLYNELLDFLEHLTQPEWAAFYIQFELSLLRESGFALKLDQCCVTGTKENLTYVSPKTGRAVCDQAAGPYKDKLLALPQFLIHPVPADQNQLKQGLDLTGYFLNLHYFEPKYKEFFTIRDRLVNLITK